MNNKITDKTEMAKKYFRRNTGKEGNLIIDELLNSMVGVTIWDGRAVYDLQAMAEEFARLYKIPLMEAMDHVDFNVLNSLNFNDVTTPIVISEVIYPFDLCQTYKWPSMSHLEKIKAFTRWATDNGVNPMSLLPDGFYNSLVATACDGRPVYNVDIMMHEYMTTHNVDANEARIAINDIITKMHFAKAEYKPVFYTPMILPLEECLKD